MKGSLTMPRNAAPIVIDEEGANPFGDAPPTLTDADVFPIRATTEPEADGYHGHTDGLFDKSATAATDGYEVGEPVDSEIVDDGAGPQLGVEVFEDEIDLIEPTPDWGEKPGEEILDNFHGMRLEIRVPTMAALTAVSFAGSSRMSAERKQKLFTAFFQMHMSPASWDGIQMRMMNPERQMPDDLYPQLSMELTRRRMEREKPTPS